jgi:hypothetical protein
MRLAKCEIHIIWPCYSPPPPPLTGKKAHCQKKEKRKSKDTKFLFPSLFVVLVLVVILAMLLW